MRRAIVAGAVAIAGVGGGIFASQHSTAASKATIAAQAKGPATFGKMPADLSKSPAPDYVSVVGDDDRIIGYVDSRFLLNIPDQSAIRPEDEGTILVPVVNKKMELVAYLGPEGVVSLDQKAAMRTAVAVADLNDYLTPTPYTPISSDNP